MSSKNSIKRTGDFVTLMQPDIGSITVHVSKVSVICNSKYYMEGAKCEPNQIYIKIEGSNRMVNVDSDNYQETYEQIVEAISKE